MRNKKGITRAAPPMNVIVIHGHARRHGRLVDELGALMAQVAPTNKRIQEIKDQLKAEAGDGRIEGTIFEAVISSTTVEAHEVKKHSRQTIEVHARTALGAA